MSRPSSCNRCGGSLPPPDDDDNIVCPGCGLFHHVGDSGPGLPPPPPSPPPPTPLGGPGAAAPGGPFGAGAAVGAGVPTFGPTAPPAAGTTPTPGRRRRRGPGLGCLLALVILAATLVPIGFAVYQAGRAVSRAGGGDTDLELTVTTGDSEVVTGAGGRPTEVVGLAQPVGSGDRVVARVAIDGEVAWTAPVVPADVYSAQFRVTDDLVLASLGAEVVALDRATGASRWRASASDEVDPRCRHCFAVLGDTLVVLGRDATVTALDVADGSGRWSRRLESPRGSTHVVGGTLLVVDQVDLSGPASLAVTDPATGEVGGRITPSCPDPAYPAELAQVIAFQPDSPVIPVPGSDDVVLAFGSTTTCVQRWTLPDPRMRWSRAAELGSGLTDPTTTADGTDLVISDSSALVHVGLSEGSMTALPLPRDTAPAGPAVLAGGRLVTAVTSSRGTARLSLLAFDLRRGEALWDRALPRGVEAFDLSPDRSTETLFAGDARFLLAPAGADDVALVTLASPGQRLTVEHVAVATGRARPVGRDTFALRYEGSTSPSARIERVTGGRVVFTTESIPQVLDLATGRVTEGWAG
ncbi:MAG TPA: PQQ-binding-like beta-propeller repeat protein [Acidimicrobiales bacterium]|nr:PQQ-binding-like beta-propeller repeat protein [Acidimicrobiales bacterium]